MDDEIKELARRSHVPIYLDLCEFVSKVIVLKENIPSLWDVKKDELHADCRILIQQTLSEDRMGYLVIFSLYQ